ncbi:MAG: flagellar motor switch phosphatase FliY [Clostridiales bacterium]|jgi:flagellar motor switch protein FliN/FliY|nr:flagellar motor switch phosphatase FliY [Clostridiales bacterium]
MADALEAKNLAKSETSEIKKRRGPGRPRKKVEDAVSPENHKARAQDEEMAAADDAAIADGGNGVSSSATDDAGAKEEANGDSPSEDSGGANVGEDGLNDKQRDILGEISNICMGTSATTLSMLVGKKVVIDAPSVFVKNCNYITEIKDFPCLSVNVHFTTGIHGSNVLVLKNHDVKVIASLMMDGDGTIDEGKPLEEIEISAVSEAMNQMIGSSSTSMAVMLKRKVDIDAPNASIMEEPVDNFLRLAGFDTDDRIVFIVFRMRIENVMDSEIIQIFEKSLAIDMLETFEESTNDMNPAPLESERTAPELAAPSLAQASPPPVARPLRQNQDVNVKSARFQNFSEGGEARQKENIDIIMDVPLEVTVELGRTRKKIKEILEFAPGSVVELDKLAGEAVDIFVNGKFVARGEVVVIDENFGVRVTDIISPEKRI